MPLMEHLAELRRRLFLSALAIVVAAILGWVNYDWIIGKLIQPQLDFQAARPDTLARINFGSGITDAFAIQITVSLFVGFLVATPVWMYQLWSFIVPGLTRKEKRRTLLFLLVSTPLFLAGCLLAYLTLPRAVEVLRGFTPLGAASIQDASTYLNFVLKFIVAFGVAFLLPVFLVALDLVGVLTARTMLRAWRGAVMGIMIFAALITPTTDPYTMFLIGIPMVVLFFAAVGVSAIVDRRRRRNDPEWLATPDDQASSLS